MRCLVLFAMICAMPFPAAAQIALTSQTAPGQTPPPAQTPPPSGGQFADLPIPSWAKSIIDSFDKPLHPVIGGLAPGGGLGAGIGYDTPEEGGRWYNEFEALATIRGYWGLRGETGIRSESRRSRLGVFGIGRNMNRLDFYGIGPDTPESARSDFTLRDGSFGVRGWHRVTQPLRIGGWAWYYLADLGPGHRNDVPDTQVAFPGFTIPGDFITPRYGIYRGFAELIYPAFTPTHPDDHTRNDYHGAYQLVFEQNQDLSFDGQFEFHRWEAETKHQFRGFRHDHRLTLHAFAESINDNATVPFYMLYTLGGSGGLKAFRPDLLGSDDTRATLRGFKNFRFRDKDLILFQAEYRIPLTDHIHTTVFVDSGQVAPRVEDFFSEMKTDTGFSVSYMNKGRTVARLDVGCCGGEGVHVFFNLGGAVGRLK